MMQNTMAFNPYYGVRIIEEIPMKNIVDPRDVDVLCGRGGAALRHPGNQTYRRLVNMNKAIYTTCLKTEKLKISRSIVAAIREQRGRFLERDGNFGTWYDIGDKKAIEKTSQALREGQPKLRQKMVEEGTGNTVPTISLAQQFANGMYPGNSQGAQMPPAAAAAAGFTGPAGYGMQMGVPPPPPPTNMPSPQQMMAQQQMMQQMGNMASQQPNCAMNQELSDMMMQRLNLTNAQGATNAAPSANVSPEATAKAPTEQELDMKMQQEKLRQQERELQEQKRQLEEQQKELAEQQKQLRIQQEQAAAITRMQELSSSMETSQETKEESEPEAAPMKKEIPTSSVAPSGKNARSLGKGITSMQSEESPADSKPPTPIAPKENEGVRKLDRRRLFARMKFHRTASGRFPSRSTTSLDKTNGNDMLPDIHMMDSNFSLLSNISSTVGSKRNVKSGDRGKMGDALGSSDHRRDDFMLLGSRRSMMSGISGDSSEGNSIFSDLSKKIGNVSTRSIAMSEISGIEEGNHEDIDESFHLDQAMQLNRAFEEEKSIGSRSSTLQQMPV